MNRSGFARSAAFLRVNKVVYNEARVFVYSQNRFLFGHCLAKSGQYFEYVHFRAYHSSSGRSLAWQDKFREPKALCSPRNFLMARAFASKK